MTSKEYLCVRHYTSYICFQSYKVYLDMLRQALNFAVIYAKKLSFKDYGMQNIMFFCWPTFFAEISSKLLWLHKPQIAWMEMKKYCLKYLFSQSFYFNFVFKNESYVISKSFNNQIVEIKSKCCWFSFLWVVIH